jgi:hypothetical protein
VNTHRIQPTTPFETTSCAAVPCREVLCDQRHFAGAEVLMPANEFLAVFPVHTSSISGLGYEKASVLLVGTPKASNRSGLQIGNATQVSVASMHLVHTGSCADNRRQDE